MKNHKNQNFGVLLLEIYGTKVLLPGVTMTLIGSPTWRRGPKSALAGQANNSNIVSRGDTRSGPPKRPLDCRRRRHSKGSCGTPD